MEISHLESRSINLLVVDPARQDVKIITITEYIAEYTQNPIFRQYVINVSYTLPFTMVYN